MSDNNAPHNAAHWAPDHHAGGGPVQEPLGETVHPTHHGDHDPAHHNDPASVAKEMKKYWAVFFALCTLTIITVGISYLHLPTAAAIALGLTVATIKGSLVAAVFMHLISERKLIYSVLVITVVFFGVLMWGPWHHRNNAKDVWPQYDQSAKAAATPAAGAHDNKPAH
jgi:cytochrome c oxidase subunit IV